jgi:dipeptidyl aminopeptidase/acylaminoacyl peptidase
MLRASILLASVTAFSFAFGQKKILDHSVYDGWRSLANVTLSNDGKWVGYIYRPQEGDAVGELRNVVSGKIISLPRVSNWRFTEDSKFLIATHVALQSEVKKAAAARPAQPAPKNKMVVVDLAKEESKTIDNVSSWSLAAEGSNWVLYQPDTGTARSAGSEGAGPGGSAGGGGRRGQNPGSGAASATQTAPAMQASAEGQKKSEHRAGSNYILHRLSDGAESTFANVASATWNEKGSRIALVISSADGKTDGIELVDPANGAKKEVVRGLGRYTRLTFDKSGDRLAFTTDRDDYKPKYPQHSLYVYSEINGQLQKYSTPKSSEGFTLSSNGALGWSDSGRRLFFPIGPRPVDAPDIPEDEKVSVDVWNWKDPILQPMQLLQAAADRNRTYDCMLDLASGNVRQLESPELTNVNVLAKRDGKYATALDPQPYRQETSWDGSYADLYLIDVTTGSKTKLATKVRGSLSASPSGNRLAFFDSVTQRLYVIDPATKQQTDVTARVPASLFDTEDDHPDLYPPYGGILWSKDETELVVRDKYDYWAVPLNSSSKARNLTNGGMARMRISRTFTESEESGLLDLENDLFLIQDEVSKQSGIIRYQNGRQQRIMYGPKAYGGVQKAKNADTVVYTQQDAREYPDLWLTDVKFSEPRKITDTNPQIKEYNWHTTELVTWRSADGQLLQGLLVKPEDFDYRKKYPMISYFYEKNSDTLYQHRTPAPSASTINIPLFASQGYIIFIPDIPYKIGYPGESAVSAIVSGCNSIIDRGYVDPKRVGIQGQSWGGYQVAYLVTETDMFACAEAGAPVSNMFSAYGGIRYGSGMVRQFQYERGQSRIGGTPWNATLKYVENSPLFHLDKVKTPLMIMHNDRDGAVPYTQGIELFVGLRRLQKPAWMVVYNGEDHNLVQRKNRKDLSIRLSQFFDHFLKGAPMPVWMSEGVPAKDKGYTMGTEIPKG